MNLGGMKDMKSNVTKKAKKQIDDIIEKLKTNEFLQQPGIQTLIEKVQKNPATNLTTEKVEAKETPETVVQSTSEEKMSDESAPKKSRSSKKKSFQLLDLIKTNEVTNRIANTVLSTAGDLNQKWLENVDEIKRTAEKATKEVTGQAKKAANQAKKAAKEAKKAANDAATHAKKAANDAAHQAKATALKAAGQAKDAAYKAVGLKAKKATPARKKKAKTAAKAVQTTPKKKTARKASKKS